MTYYLNPVNGQSRFVHLNGEYYLLSDEEIKVGDLRYDGNNNSIGTCINAEEQKYLNSNPLRFYKVFKKINLKVDVEKMATKHATTIIQGHKPWEHLNQIKYNSFIAGYNSKQGGWTDEDLRKAFEAGMKVSDHQYIGRLYNEPAPPAFEEFIESLARIYSDRSASRFREMFNVVILEGTDRRK